METWKGEKKAKQKKEKRIKLAFKKKILQIICEFWVISRICHDFMLHVSTNK
jgi:hypothetical protein